MRKIIFILILTVTFLNCNDDVKSELEIVVGKSLQSLKLKDQFGEFKNIKDDTKRVIFTFSKDMGRLCNDFFNSKEPAFLAKKHTIFVADISSAPSLIRSMFIIDLLQNNATS